MTSASAVAVIGPALPALHDVAREFPHWQGVAGLLYARLTRSCPPLTVRAATSLELRAEISRAETDA
jgi:hypothetical protein